MKKIGIIVLLLVVTCTAWSQQKRGQRPEPPSIEERLEQAKEQLTLTDDQVVEWKTIFEKYDDKIQEARQNRDRKTGESLRNTLNEELMATLDEAQQEKFKELQKNRPERGRRRG
ncbi:MAG: hypothetical protein R8G66_08290 [Cytophagales bacterium]|nr:hypothetical protein [Cytophagales bacterium]